MLHFNRAGNGKTIVFIHGVSQAATVWKDLLQQPSLAGYCLVSVDLPGHGQSFRSSNPAKDYTLQGMAAHLPGFLKQFDNYMIVTNSLAGNLVAEVLPQLNGCKGLFLTGASIIGNAITVPQIVKPSPYFAVTFTAQPTDEELRGLVGTLTFQGGNALTHYFIKQFKDTDPAVRTQLGAAIGEGQWTDELAALKKVNYPVAIVYGAEEKIIFPDYLDKCGIDIWQHAIIKIPAAGHCCQFDQPVQLANLITQYAAEVF